MHVLVYHIGGKHSWFVQVLHQNDVLKWSTRLALSDKSGTNPDLSDLYLYLKSTSIAFSCNKGETVLNQATSEIIYYNNITIIEAAT